MISSYCFVNSNNNYALGKKNEVKTNNKEQQKEEEEKYKNAEKYFFETAPFLNKILSDITVDKIDENGVVYLKYWSLMGIFNIFSWEFKFNLKDFDKACQDCISEFINKISTYDDSFWTRLNRSIMNRRKVGELIDKWKSEGKYEKKVNGFIQSLKENLKKQIKEYREKNQKSNKK